MKKIILMLTAGVITLFLIGCYVSQTDNVPIIQTTDIFEAQKILENETINTDETEEIENPIDKELVRNTEVTQISHIEPIEPVIPQNQASTTNPVITSEQLVTQSPSTSSQTPLLPQEPQPKPQQTPEPKPEPIPAITTPPTSEPPAPQPPLAPETPPQPPPVIVEPLPARTICNICEADITGIIAAHGTEYLLRGENFSYRVE